MIEGVKKINIKVNDFKEDAHKILSSHESSVSRVISVEGTKKRLTTLSVRQEELLTESLLCIKYGLFRSAHVSGWLAFIDYLEEKLGSDSFAKVMGVRQRLGPITTVEELREKISEYQLIEVSREIGLITKAEMRILHGHLFTRHQCAHPSSYRPDMNDSLGYVSNLIKFVEGLQTRLL